ncbi:hypothetical protein [Herpetosiphon geysericola]|uniref:Uncharacterized protein n=1 Tax=Herpetosiphon geysericola TaxID=70996 RepID=A0A0P6Y6M3_9CHLR|nr:hypothetical protein [Herpetosiphon geysericola]KPL85267.1 hypothetical protein SE18_16425 [Herpetosiphon geysericola]
MQLEQYPSREATIELPALALLTAPGDQRSVVGMGTVLRKLDGGKALIGVLAFDQLYLLVDNKVMPFTPALSIRHESGKVMGNLSINAGATNLIQTRYWKSRPLTVADLEPVYDQIDDAEQSFCSYLASRYQNPNWRKWIYERYQPAKEPIATTLDEVLEYLLSRLSPHTPPSLFSETLQCLSWIMDDDGSDIYRIMREWLKSDDKEKVKVALSIEEVLLLTSDEAYQTTVARIVGRWPELEPMCYAFQQIWEGHKNYGKGESKNEYDD